MKSPGQEDPRANQKQRTRAAIVDAALSLIREGTLPSVQAAAEAARVSRATGYRYFPTQDSLVNEVMSITPSTDAVDRAITEGLTHDIETDVLDIVDRVNPTILDDEPRYRTALRLYHDLWLEANARGKGPDEETPPIRAGRRMRWIDAATGPLESQLPPEALRRVQNALALTIGMDSLAIMKDVCGIEDEEAIATLRWAAEAIIAAANAEAGRPAPASPPSPPSES